MAFPNLFTGLPAFGEDYKSQNRANVKNRNQTNNEKGGRKRKPQDEQPGPYNKRRCYQPKANTPFDAYNDNNTRAKFHQKHDFGGKRKLVSQTKEMTNNHAHKSGSNTRLHKGEKNQTKNNSNSNKQQYWGKRTEKDHQQHKNKGRHDYKDRRPMSRQGGRSSTRITQVKTRWMSDEFKEQNAVLVDGQLICRHFLSGRCIKADDCQLKHLQAYNGLIKEVCKFYIQGFCTKGESCPYMHKSFPCKFFHRNGRCAQDVNCRFSHKPLNEVTERLLNEAFKRENDLYELAKAKEESAMQPENSEESEITEASKNHDAPLQPIRPSFYHSTDAEKESSVHQPEELADNKEEHGSDAARPHSPSSTDCTPVEPVSYSVEAVLRPQPSRPFFSFFTTPGSQESNSVSVPQAASDSTLGSKTQGEVPYSVDAVLRSYKPIGQTCSPPRAQTLSYTPKTGLQNQNKKVSLNIMAKACLPKDKTYKSLASLQGQPTLISKTYPDVFLASGEHKDRGEETSPCQKAAQTTFPEVKLELLSSPAGEAEKPASSPPQPPAELKPSLTGLTSDTESFREPVSPSLGSKEFKGPAAAPVEPVTSSVMTRRSAYAAVHHFAVKQLTEIHLNPRRTRPAAKRSTLERNSAKITPPCPNKMPNDGDFSVERNKSQTKIVKPASDSVMAPACPQPPADVTVEQTPASSFLSLFALPLREIPASSPCLPPQTALSLTPSCSQQNTSSEHKQRASGLETSVQHRATTDAKQASPSSASSKFSCENENNLGKQVATPVCRPVSDSPNDPSSSGDRQQLPDVSSPRDTAAETSSGSVLKTLFSSLKPYREDLEQQNGDQNTVRSEGGKKDSMACGLLKQEIRRNNGLKDMDSATLTCHKQSAEKTHEKARDSAEDQLSFRASSKAAGPSPINQRGLTKSSVRISGTHSFPFRAVTPVIKHHTQPRAKPTSEEGGMAATPFKDLFKTLEMSVFSSGH